MLPWRSRYLRLCEVKKHKGVCCVLLSLWSMARVFTSCRESSLGAPIRSTHGLMKYVNFNFISENKKSEQENRLIRECQCIFEPLVKMHVEELMPATNPNRRSLEMFVDSYLCFHRNYGNDRLIIF